MTGPRSSSKTHAISRGQRVFSIAIPTTDSNLGFAMIVEGNEEHAVMQAGEASG